MATVDIGADGLTFDPLPDDEVAAFLEESRQGFIEGQVAAGVERSVIEDRTQAMHAEILPGGRLSPDDRIGRLVAGGDPVGHLWLARNDDSSWYVWDIAIEPSHQGRGFGRAGMQMAEAMAQSDGAQEIGLSVLATNDVARSLYASMGYETVDPQAGPLIRMIKQLGAHGGEESPRE